MALSLIRYTIYTWTENNKYQVYFLPAQKIFYNEDPLKTYMEIEIFIREKFNNDQDFVKRFFSKTSKYYNQRKDHIEKNSPVLYKKISLLQNFKVLKLKMNL